MADQNPNIETKEYLRRTLVVRNATWFCKINCSESYLHSLASESNATRLIVTEIFKELNIELVNNPLLQAPGVVFTVGR